MLPPLNDLVNRGFRAGLHRAFEQDKQKEIALMGRPLLERRLKKLSD